jgi:hypothetical protein
MIAPWKILLVSFFAGALLMAVGMLFGWWLMRHG